MAWPRATWETGDPSTISPNRCRLARRFVPSGTAELRRRALEPVMHVALPVGLCHGDTTSARGLSLGRVG